MMHPSATFPPMQCSPKLTMKNLILTLTLAASVATPLTLIAQEAKPERPKQGREAGPGGGPRMNPEERLKFMTEKLSLTSEQQDKVKAIFESGREEAGKLREVPEGERREKFGAFMKAQNEKIVAVLTPEQQEKYKALAAERGRGGDRPGGPGGPRGEGAKGDGGKRPDGGSKPEAEAAKAAEKK